MHFYTQPLSLRAQKLSSYGTTGTGKHQKTLGLFLFLVNCYQRNALPAFYQAVFLAGITVCGNGVCQGHGYHVSV